MSASGKSHNRLHEWGRGYYGTGGHGIYADQGRRDRTAHDRIEELSPSADHEQAPAQLDEAGGE